VIPAALVGLALLLLLAINLYLQSSQVQERIRLATAASIGLPVEIGGAAYTPWSGLTLSRISVADPERPSEELFTARKLNARMALWPLLQRKVVITAVRLIDPILVVPEDSQGVVLPPPRAEVVVTEPVPGTSPPKLQPPETAPAETAEPSESLPPPKKSAPSYKIEVQSFAIENGGIIVRDPLGKPGLKFEKIQLRTQIESNAEQSGHVSIGTIGLARSLFIRDFSAPFSRANGVLTLPDFRGELAGGTLAGNFQFEEAASVINLQSALQGVVVPQLLQEAGFSPGRSSGVLQGALKLQGPVMLPEALAGEGRFELLEGQLEPIEFVRQLGQLLRIDELQLLQLEEALLELALADGAITVRQLSLLSENLWFRGEGGVDLQGGLDLRGRFLINERMHRNLGGLLGAPFGPSEEPGYRELAFNIGGTVQNPRTDLLDRFAGGRIGQEVGRFLQNLLRPAPTPKKEE
jgi:uncharacterized protein involved in outer membrane biogenesis